MLRTALHHRGGIYQRGFCIFTTGGGGGGGSRAWSLNVKPLSPPPPPTARILTDSGPGGVTGRTIVGHTAAAKRSGTLFFVPFQP